MPLGDSFDSWDEEQKKKAVEEPFPSPFKEPVKPNLLNIKTEDVVKKNTPIFQAIAEGVHGGLEAMKVMNPLTVPTLNALTLADYPLRAVQAIIPSALRSGAAAIKGEPQPDLVREYVQKENQGFGRLLTENIPGPGNLARDVPVGLAGLALDVLIDPLNAIGLAAKTTRAVRAEEYLNRLKEIQGAITPEMTGAERSAAVMAANPSFGTRWGIANMEPRTEAAKALREAIETYGHEGLVGLAGERRAVQYNLRDLLRPIGEPTPMGGEPAKWNKLKILDKGPKAETGRVFREEKTRFLGEREVAAYQDAPEEVKKIFRTQEGRVEPLPERIAASKLSEDYMLSYGPDSRDFKREMLDRELGTSNTDAWKEVPYKYERAQNAHHEALLKAEKEAEAAASLRSQELGRPVKPVTVNPKKLPTYEPMVQAEKEYTAWDHAVKRTQTGILTARNQRIATPEDIGEINSGIEDNRYFHRLLTGNDYDPETGQIINVPTIPTGGGLTDDLKKLNKERAALAGKAKAQKDWVAQNQGKLLPETLNSVLDNQKQVQGELARYDQQIKSVTERIAQEKSAAQAAKKATKVSAQEGEAGIAPKAATKPPGKQRPPGSEVPTRAAPVPPKATETLPTVKEMNESYRPIGGMKEAKDIAVAGQKKIEGQLAHERFTESMTPMVRAKTEKTLNVSVMNKGRPISRRALVEEKIAAGAVVKLSSKGTRRLVTPDGLFLDESQISKTAMDYAEYLSKNPPTEPPISPQGAIPQSAKKGAEELFHAGYAGLKEPKKGEPFHVGTRKAALDRITRPSERGTKRSIYKVTVEPKNPYMPEGRILDERLGEDRTFLFELENLKQERQKLIDQGYDVVPYINSVEDEGSISYMVLDPKAVKNIGVSGKGAVSHAGKFVETTAFPRNKAGEAVNPTGAVPQVLKDAKAGKPRTKKIFNKVADQPTVDDIKNAPDPKTAKNFLKRAAEDETGSFDATWFKTIKDALVKKDPKVAAILAKADAEEFVKAGPARLRMARGITDLFERYHLAQYDRGLIEAKVTPYNYHMLEESDIVKKMGQGFGGGLKPGVEGFQKRRELRLTISEFNKQADAAGHPELKFSRDPLEFMGVYARRTKNQAAKYDMLQRISNRIFVPADIADAGVIDVADNRVVLMKKAGVFSEEDVKKAQGYEDFQRYIHGSSPQRLIDRDAAKVGRDVELEGGELRGTKGENSWGEWINHIKLKGKTDALVPEEVQRVLYAVHKGKEARAALKDDTSVSTIIDELNGLGREKMLDLLKQVQDHITKETKEYATYGWDVALFSTKGFLKEIVNGPVDPEDSQQLQALAMRISPGKNDILTELGPDEAALVRKYVKQKRTQVFLAQREVADAINRHGENINRFSDDVRGSLGVLDGINRFWAKGATRYFPSYWTNNILGDIYRYIVWGGTDPRDIAKAWDIVTKLHKGEDMTLVNKFGEKIKASELYEKARSSGELKTFIQAVGGSLKRETPDPTSNPFVKLKRKAQFPFQKMADAAQDTESRLRFSQMYDSWNKGLSLEAAALRAKKFALDYTNLSDTERKIFVRAAPFYNYQRQIMPLTLEIYARRPVLMTLDRKMQDNFQIATGREVTKRDQAIQSKYEKLNVAVKISDSPTGYNYIFLGRFMPGQSLRELLSDPITTVYNQIGPIRTVGESVIGGKARPYVKEMPWAKGAGFYGVQLPERVVNVLEAYRPIRAFNRMVSERPTDPQIGFVGNPKEFIKTLFGLSLDEVESTEEATKKAAARAKSEHSKILNMRRKNQQSGRVNLMPYFTPEQKQRLKDLEDAYYYLTGEHLPNTSE